MVFKQPKVVMLDDDCIVAIRIMAVARGQELALVGENPNLIAIYGKILKSLQGK